jgi:DNA-binding NarL/FixJ family response regulator
MKPQPGELEVHTFRVGDEQFALLSLPALPSARLDRLTAAERAVLKALLRGRSNLAIAQARRVSVRTIANQVASVFAKLGVRSRSELAAHWR